MKRIIPLLLMLLMPFSALGQTPPPAPPVVPVFAMTGPTTVAPYTLADFKVTGGLADSITWVTFPPGSITSSVNLGQDFVFVAPPGTYTVMAFVAPGGKVFQANVTFTGSAPTPPPPPAPTPPSPTPPPTPAPPAPTPAPSAACNVVTPMVEPASFEPAPRVTSTPIDPTATTVITTADPMIQFGAYKVKEGYWIGPSKAAERAVNAARQMRLPMPQGLDEFQRRHFLLDQGSSSITGFKPPANLKANIQDHKAKPEAAPRQLKLRGPAPDPTAKSFSWLSQGILGPPHDQGQCGSCWDFSSCKVFSGAFALQHGYIQEPSEQYVLNGDHNNGNSACQGGNTAFDFLINPGGICLAKMPYVGYAQSFTQQTADLKAASWSYIDGQTDENTIPTVAQIKAALCKYGPLWVTLDASSGAFSGYSGGVFVGRQSPYGGMFSPIATDHAVTMYGWDDNANSVGAWRMMNSWGPDWGVKGLWLHQYGTANIGYMAAQVAVE